MVIALARFADLIHEKGEKPISAFMVTNTSELVSWFLNLVKEQVHFSVDGKITGFWKSWAKFVMKNP